MSESVTVLAIRELFPFGCDLLYYRLGIHITVSMVNKYAKINARQNLVDFINTPLCKILYLE